MLAANPVDLANRLLAQKASSTALVPQTQSPLLQSYGQWVAGRQVGPALPRTMQDFLNGAFGPLEPLVPMPIDEPDSSGRPGPRRWQYPIGWNLPVGIPGTEGLKLASFQALRRYADIYSVLRAALNIRIGELVGLVWDVGPTPDAEEGARGKRDVQRDLKERSNLARAFWKRPDPDYYGFQQWFKAALEDKFVIDALSYYLHPTRVDGKGPFKSSLAAIELLDGATIRPLLDLHGATPRPPAPAYQQFLWGVPRSDLMDMLTGRDLEAMDNEGIDEPEKQYAGDQMLYMIDTRRSHTPYGFSAVEQAILPISIGLKRQEFLLDFFTEGTIPGVYVIAGEQYVTPTMQRQLQDNLNAIAGDLAYKHRVIVLPPGSHTDTQKDFSWQAQVDQTILEQIAMILHVQPHELGAVPGGRTSGLGGSGMIQQQQQSVDATRTLGDKAFFKNTLFDWVIQELWGQKDLEWKWVEDVALEDEERRANVEKSFISIGLQTIDEARIEQGKDPYGLPLTSTPWLMGGPQGITPLDPDAAKALQEMQPAPPPAPPGMGGPGGPPGAAGAPKPGKNGKGPFGGNGAAGVASGANGKNGKNGKKNDAKAGAAPASDTSKNISLESPLATGVVPFDLLPIDNATAICPICGEPLGADHRGHNEEADKIIRKEGDEYVLYTRDGSRVLGRHKTRREAYAQEAAIEHSQANKYDESQARDDDGKWTAGGGGGGSTDAEAGRQHHDLTGHATPGKAAIEAVAAGHVAHIRADQVADLMAAGAEYKGPALDLTDISVDGTRQFGIDGLGFSRSEMPQVPSDRRDEFLDSLRDEGVTVTEKTVDPKDLQPSQKEINVAKVSGMYAAMEAGTMPDEAILTSQDQYVLDGHHRWGAATARSIVKGGAKIRVFEIGMDARAALDAANKWTEAQGIAHAALVAQAALHKITVADLVKGKVRYKGDLTDIVYEYLLRSYPKDVIEWAKDPEGEWEFDPHVKLSDINMARRPGGRDPDKVDSISETLDTGASMDPIVLIDDGKDAGYTIADGWHRTLGAEKSGWDDLPAFIGHHFKQYSDLINGEMQDESASKKLAELAALRNFVRKPGRKTSDFTPKFLSVEDLNRINADMVALGRARAFAAARERVTGLPAARPNDPADLLKMVDAELARRGLRKYSEDQARDDHGRWTAEGGGDDSEGAPMWQTRDVTGVLLRHAAPSRAAMIQKLSVGKIDGYKSAKYGASNAFTANIGNQKVLIKAKSEMDARKIRDSVPAYSDLTREPAAQLINGYMGELVDMPASTVVPDLTDANGRSYGKAMVQEFRNGAANRGLALRSADPDEVHNLALFDAVIGNEDRHSGNGLMMGNHIIAIDHGLSFPSNVGGEWGNYDAIEAVRGGVGGQRLTGRDRALLQGLIDHKPDIMGALQQLGIQSRPREAMYHRIDKMLQQGEILSGDQMTYGLKYQRRGFRW